VLDGQRRGEADGVEFALGDQLSRFAAFLGTDQPVENRLMDVRARVLEPLEQHRAAVIAAGDLDACAADPFL